MFQYKWENGACRSTAGRRPLKRTDHDSCRSNARRGPAGAGGGFDRARGAEARVQARGAAGPGGRSAAGPGRRAGSGADVRGRATGRKGKRDKQLEDVAAGETDQRTLEKKKQEIFAQY